MAFGRPTKYTPELLEKVEHYIENHQDFEDLVPSIAGLACAVDVTKETLYQWEKDPSKKHFSDMLRKIKQKQERMLLSGGLGGAYNPAITKLMLAKHDYSEKSQQEISGANGSAIETKMTVEFVSAKKD